MYGLNTHQSRSYFRPSASSTLIYNSSNNLTKTSKKPMRLIQRTRIVEVRNTSPFSVSSCTIFGWSEETLERTRRPANAGISNRARGTQSSRNYRLLRIQFDEWMGQTVIKKIYRTSRATKIQNRVLRPFFSLRITTADRFEIRSSFRKKKKNDLHLIHDREFSPAGLIKIRN